MEQQEREKQIEELAAQVLRLSRDEVIIHLRFLDAATAGLSFGVGKVKGGAACDGKKLYYDPVFVLQSYQKESAWMVRLYLHVLLHFVFFHSFRCDKLDTKLWDMAADAAVENVILELSIPSFSLKGDDSARRKLQILKEDAGGLTAEQLYRYWKRNGIRAGEAAELLELFYRDEHFLWKEATLQSATKEQWKKISERVKTEMEAFSGEERRSESIGKNLWEAVRERYDYDELLRKFTVMGENLQINEEEFDYVSYTYGLHYYGNMPLIEPLEYKEEHKIKEFVIVIDTSASCRGSVVRAFLKRTYDILKGTENFFHKINVHILQCDNEVQMDTKITDKEEFDSFLEHGSLKGFGGTDFRPVFEYVDKLLGAGEFENLKGLIYFTDGYGIYPERMPGYEVIFAFTQEDENRIEPPAWALSAVLEEETLEEEAT